MQRLQLDMTYIMCPCRAVINLSWVVYGIKLQCIKILHLIIQKKKLKKVDIVLLVRNKFNLYHSNSSANKIYAYIEESKKKLSILLYTD